MAISPEDLQNAARLSIAAYENSDGLLTTLSGTNWQPIGSDPVLSGPFQGQELPKPASLSALQSWDAFFGEGIGDSNFLFDNGNAQAFVARNTLDNSLAIVFRGTNSVPDLITDVIDGTALTFDFFYNKFSKLLESLDQYIAQHQITKVLVAGHSLGGVTAEWFMADHNDGITTKYIGVTFGSPGDSYLNGVNDSRLINFGHSEDPVANAAQDYQLGSRDVEVDLQYINGFAQNYAGLLQLLGNLSEHSADLYKATADNIAGSPLFSYFIQNPHQYNVIIGAPDAADLIFGTDSGVADFILGTGGSDKLFGESGNDLIDGGSGDDPALSGGFGNDLISGGPGIDTAVYSFRHDQYDFSVNGSALVVSAKPGVPSYDGTDTVLIDQINGVENFQFSDGTYTLAQLFPPSDTSPPTLSSSSPADNATNISRATNITLTFSETVFRGAGNIDIHKTSDGTVSQRIPVTDAAQVLFSGATVTINPNVDLSAGTAYYVTVDSGSIHDRAGNSYSGISSPTTLNFTTSSVADTSVPLLTGTSPTDNAINVAVDANVNLVFNESVGLGSGFIEIHKSDGTVFRSVAVSDSNQIAVSGNTVTLDSSVDLAPSTDYYVTVSTGAIRDIAGNSYPGFTSTGVLNFTTASAPNVPPPPNTYTTFLSVTDNSIREGTSGASLLSFGVNVTGPGAGTQTVSVQYATQDIPGASSPATAGQDYVAASSVLVIPAGQTFGTVDIQVFGDTQLEPDEVFRLALSQPSTGVTLLNTFATGFIDNDDQAPNRLPITAYDLAITAPNTPVTIAVLVNDSDPDGDPLQISEVFSVTDGSASIVDGGQHVQFTPTNGFAGVGTFSYTVSDGHGGLKSSYNNEVLVSGDGSQGITNTGTDGDDLISGAAGNDTLSGGFGNDVITGGPGSDRINGGAGFDSLDLRQADHGANIQFRDPWTWDDGDGGHDVLQNMEGVLGTRFSDYIVGSSGNIVANTTGYRFYGNEGDDRLQSDAGDDVLDGGAGNDTLIFGAGRDLVFGGVGDDQIYSFNGGSDTVGDELHGGPGDDRVYATDGMSADTITGDEGNDYLQFSNGDVVSGGSGTDIFRFGGFNAAAPYHANITDLSPGDEINWNFPTPVVINNTASYLIGPITNGSGATTGLDHVEYETANGQTTLYFGYDDNPGADFVLSIAGTFLLNQFQVNASDPANLRLLIQAANAVPILDLNGASTGIDFNAAFTENGGAIAVVSASGLTVTDADNTTLSSATVTLTNHPDGTAESVAVNTAGTSIVAAAYDSATGLLSLSGSATLANYQQVLRTVTYNNTSENPSTAARSITVVVNDGQAPSVTATSTVTVTAVNDAPVVDLNGASAGTGFSASFTENGGAAAIVSTSGLTASDVDSANLTGATITLTNHPNGAVESVSVNTSGTSIVAAAYNSTTGVLALSGSASVASYQQVLRTLTYNNTSENPNTASRSVTVTVSDGQAVSTAPTATVSVTAVNDAPVVDLNGASAGTGFNASFTENGGAIAIVSTSGLTVTDADSTNLTGATVTLTSRPDGVSESIALDTSGTSIVAAAYNSTTGVLALSGGATLAQYQQVLRTLTYNNISENPNTAARSITVVVNDGQASSATATATVSTSAVNDAPVVDLNGASAGTDFSGSFTENGGAVAIVSTSGLTVSDVDSANLAGATITLTNHPDGAAESLAVNTTGTPITAASYNSTTGVLALSGTGSLANYQQVLRTLTYNNTSENPGTAARSVTVAVSDGQASSATATSTVSVTAVNDAPVNTIPGAQSTNEDTPKVIGGISVADVDAGSSNILVTLAQTSGTIAVNTAVAGGVSAGSITGNNTGTITLTGSLTQINNTLANATGVTYAPTANFNGSAQLTVSTNDNGAAGSGGAKSDTDNIAITVTAVNDAPVLDASKSPVLDAVTQGSGAPAGAVGTLVSTLADLNPPVGGLDNVTDVDAGAIAGIAVTGANAANGSWWYSINNGGAWNPLGSVSDSSARLLAADSNTRVYFQPNTGFTGTISNGLTFRAWDRTSGSNGGTGNASANGGTTAFSSSIDSAGATVVAANSAPVVTINGSLRLDFNQWINGNDARIDALIDAVDPDGNAIVGGEVRDLAAGGAYLWFAGRDIPANEAVSFTQADLDAGRLWGRGGPDAGTSRFEVRYSDGTLWSAWTPFDVVTRSNTAPVATPTAATQTVGVNQTVAASTLFGASDPDGDQITMYRFWDAGSGGGHFTVNGVTRSALQNIDLGPPQTIFEDPFEANGVGSSKWHIPTWVSPTDGTFVGQTQFRVTQNATLPVASNGDAIIKLETYNPTALPGQPSFYGTDLISNQPFTVGDGLDIKVRARMNGPATPGTVGGIFLYALNPADNSRHDEIDFELLGNRPNEVQTNIYANEPLGAGHPTFAAYSSGAITDYHTYEIKWLSNQVSWYVDGALTRTTASNIPTNSLYLHLNMWAPASDWTEAYSATIQPTSVAAGNQTFSMGVDSVVVQQLSATDLTSAQYVGGTTPGSETLWVQVSDGTVWSEWKSWAEVTQRVTNVLPVVSAPATKNVEQNQWVRLSDFASVSDGDGDPMTYRVHDATSSASSGIVYVNGVIQGQGFDGVQTGAFSDIWVRGGSSVGSDTIEIQANDGYGYGTVASFTLVTRLPNRAPVAVANPAVTGVPIGSTVAAGSLFNVTDADGDAPTQYEFYDVAGGGSFKVGNVAQPVNQVLPVSAANLGNMVYQSGVTAGSDTVWVRANDGTVWSDWVSRTIPTLRVTNVLPVVSAPATKNVEQNQWVRLSDFASVSDADGDPMTYRVHDATSSASSGIVYMNGVIQGQGFDGVQTGAFSDIWVRGGSSVGSDTIEIQANDGYGYGTVASFTLVTRLPNRAPVAVANPAVTGVPIGSTVAAGSLFNVTDADGDAPTQYEFYDVAGGGSFKVGNVAQPVNQVLPVSAANLGNMVYQSGVTAGSDTVWVRANDGTVWSDWVSRTIPTLRVTNVLPVVSAPATKNVEQNQWVRLSDFASVSDADGDPMTYRVHDATSSASSGIVYMNGVIQGQGFDGVQTGAFSDIWVRGGSSVGSDTIEIQANDGYGYGTVASFTLVTRLPNRAPVAVANPAVTGVPIGSTVAAGSLFNVTDADGDVPTQYELYDVAGGGFFKVGNVAQPVNQVLPVSAANLGNMVYQSGVTAGSDTVWVRANDGTVWSDWVSRTIPTLRVTNVLPVVSAPATKNVEQNQWVRLSDFASVSDADGDPMTYRVHDATSSASSGIVYVNGVIQGQGFDGVQTGAFSDIWVRGGTSIGTDTIEIQANDGYGSSTVARFTLVTRLPNRAPVAVANPAVTGVPIGSTVAAGSLFNVTDADGDAPTQYEFYDVAGGGFFKVGNVAQPAGQVLPVSAANLGNMVYQSGVTAGSDTVWVRANDGTVWSDWVSRPMNTLASGS